MLSYRHAFHAGNHADVLKHWVTVLCLQYLKNKDKPFLYLDTHAGAGLYDLTRAQAEKTGEYRDGIGRLWEAGGLPEPLRGYLDCVRRCNAGPLASYPGSPVIALQLLRPGDSLRLVEMHNTERAILESNCGRDRRVQIISGDGFEQVKAALPPVSRRGLVLMDPSYELKTDYQRVIAALENGLKRFATGTYLIWYPLLNSPHSQRFADQLKSVAGDKWLHTRLWVKPEPEAAGMYGSGMFVVNPPFVLHEQLQAGLPYLTDLLGCAEQSGHLLERSQQETNGKLPPG